MRKTKILVAILVIANFIVSPLAYAHPGRTDKYGCHTCRTNCTEKWNLEYGEYHCHAEKVKTIKTEAKKETRKEARRSSR